jgi:signal transduction histidine kinase
LIVEDNRRHAELITDEMCDAGIAVEVDWASTGREGLEFLESRRPDLILLDYRLPDIDGIEFMRELRARGSTTPVIFVTTADSVELAVQAMKLGAEDFLQKQEGYLEVLPLLVREAIERQRLREEKARLEQQLRQSEKLASLGILAAGLAHNINNRLTSLKTFFELLSPEDKHLPIDPHFVEVCRQDLDKIVLLVQELTRYALSDDSPRPPEPLPDLIQRALGHLDDEIQRKQIRLVTQFEKVPEIPLDAEGVKQLFINLLKNAIQATPLGGEIRVSVRSEPCEIIATVEDSGPGLPLEVRDKVFDPFFTTKDHGLGIGLYICHKIASQHRGRIEVGGEPGHGAIFSVHLPIPRDDEASRPTPGGSAISETR